MERRLTDDEQRAVEALGRGPDGRSTDVASGRGAPRWVLRSLNYCSNCGTQLVAGMPPGEDRERLACPACGFIAYVNPRLVVTTIPVTDAGEAVLLRRGIEPGYGSWAQPGGFLEVDETVTEAAIRETLEETGLLVQPGELVGLYSRLEAAVVTLVFEARIVGGVAQVTPEALEVRAFAAGRHPLGRAGLQDVVLRAARLGGDAPPRRPAALGLRGARALLALRAGGSPGGFIGRPGHRWRSPYARRRRPVVMAVCSGPEMPMRASVARASSRAASTSGSASRATPRLRIARISVRPRALATTVSLGLISRARSTASCADIGSPIATTSRRARSSPARARIARLAASP